MKNFNYKYTIRDFIDKNKWSNVYNGINKETNEKIVLNIIINSEGKEKNLEHFKEEVNLLKEINNQNIICIKEMGTYTNKDKTYYYIESESFEGITLDELTSINKLNENQSLQIISQVIKGVQSFHDKKISFGELTIEDIIINGEGQVKINTLALINNHKGHINCKAYDSKRFDQHEDVYVIGSILCEMITGKKVFDRAGNPNLDECIVEILEKSTNKKHISKYKYKNLIEFYEDINLYLNEGEINYKKETNLEKIHKLNFNNQIKKYMALACVIVILFCTTVIGGKYLLNRKNDDVANTNPAEEVDDTEDESINTMEDITPIEDNLIQHNITQETEDTVNDEDNSENNDEQNYNNQNDNEDINNQQHNNHNKNDEESDSNEDESDKDNSNKDEEDKGNNENDKDDNGDNDDEENSDIENPDNNDNSDKEDQNQNTDGEQNTDQNNENNTQDNTQNSDSE